jgi:hypothetical protein
MRCATLFGLLALVPAGLNAAAPAAMTLAVPGCEGAVHAIVIPLRPGAPASGDQPCCAKACHAGSSRKRFPCRC